jgi:uncharacterized protein YjlB
MVWAPRGPIFDSTATRGDHHDLDTVPASTCPNVFDAGLASIAYHHIHHPDDAHRIIGRARRQAPIAIGPYGPEVLSYG